MTKRVDQSGAAVLSLIVRCCIAILGVAIGLGGRASSLQAADATAASPAQTDTGPAIPLKSKSAPVSIAELQTVEITGTLIREPNARSQSPITSISSVEIQQTGTTSISNVLNSLPQVHTAQNNSTSNNATGVANLDLRGLGPTRTLVLLDGFRLGPGDPQGPEGEAADIHFIPSALVSSVDVLTGGASAAYGSDAIAGVVNFHLINDLQGVKVVQTFNEAQHTQGGPWDGILAASPSLTKLNVPGNQFGGLISDTTILFGSDLEQGRGHVTTFFSYHHENQILNGSRNFLACETGLNSAQNAIICRGSSDSAFGNIVANNGSTYALNPNGSATLVPFNRSLYGFDTSPSDCLQCGDTRKNAGAYGHLQLNNWADVYGKVLFQDDTVLTQFAAGGLAQGQGPTGQLSVPCNNPFLSSAEEPIICQDSAGNSLPVYQANGQPNVATILLPSLRIAQDIRAEAQQHTDYLTVLGVRGGIGQSDWTYDASGTYWDSLYREDYMHDLSFSKIEDSLFGCSLNSGANAGCVPVNFFQYGAITPAGLSYLETPGTATGSSAESTLNGNVSGDFGAWGGKSPWANDPVAATLGVTYRRQTLDYLPDVELQSNDLVGQGQVFPPVAGFERSIGEYVEARVPLVQEKPFVKSLTVDVAGRHTTYSLGSHPGFLADTFKVGADYAPIPDVLFRASFNRATRAPNIYELFFPQSVVSEPGEQDPCSGTSPVASLAACERTGVTPAQYGNIVPCRSAGCSGLLGGNPALRPETASTVTVGSVFTPRFARNLEFSVDYWDIFVDRFITNLPGAQILNGCLLSGIDGLCPLIHRGVNGILFGSTGAVSETNENIGFLRTRGIDVSVNYRESLADLGLPDAGALTFNFTGSYLLEQTTATALARYDCAGLYGTTCSAGDVDGPNFTWRHEARLTWLTPWHVDASVRWRYLSAVSLDSNNTQPALQSGSFDAYDAVIPVVNYLDLTFGWQASQHIKVLFGCNNCMDTDPPVLSHGVVFNFHGGANENVYSVYDLLGRELFLTLSAQF